MCCDHNPELLAHAATDLAGIGSNINAAHLSAAAPILFVLAAAKMRGRM